MNDTKQYNPAHCFVSSDWERQPMEMRYILLFERFLFVTFIDFHVDSILRFDSIASPAPPTISHRSPEPSNWSDSFRISVHRKWQSAKCRIEEIRLPAINLIRWNIYMRFRLLLLFHGFRQKAKKKDAKHRVYIHSLSIHIVVFMISMRKTHCWHTGMIAIEIFLRKSHSSKTDGRRKKMKPTTTTRRGKHRDAKSERKTCKPKQQSSVFTFGVMPSSFPLLCRFAFLLLIWLRLQSFASCRFAVP